MKKLFALLLALAVLFPMLPCKALADGQSSDQRTSLIERAVDANIPDDAVEFEGHYYKLYDEGLNWYEAKEKCLEINGHLATITSSKEQSLVEELLKNGMRNSYWLGGYRENSAFMWITGEPMQYTHWGKYQPDNHGSNEECIEVYRNTNPIDHNGLGKWNDLHYDGTCDSQTFFGLHNIGYICEWDSGIIASYRGTAFIGGANLDVSADLIKSGDELKAKIYVLGKELDADVIQDEDNYIITVDISGINSTVSTIVYTAQLIDGVLVGQAGDQRSFILVDKKIDGEDKRLEKKDVYSFKNKNSAFFDPKTEFWQPIPEIWDGSLEHYDISDAYFDILTDGMSESVVENLSSSRNSHWGGSCYGMTSGVINFKENRITPSYWQPGGITGWGRAEDVCDLYRPWLNYHVRDLINFYQLQQYLPDSRDYYLDLSEAGEQTRQHLIQLCTDAAKIKYGQNAVMLNIEWAKNETDQDGKHERGAHSILAYDCIPTCCIIENKVYCFELSIYDPSIGFSKLYVNGSFTEWHYQPLHDNYDMWVSEGIEAKFIIQVFSNIDLIDLINPETGERHTTKNDYDRDSINIKADAGSFSVTSSDGKTYTVTDGTESGDLKAHYTVMPNVMADGSTSTPEYVIYIDEEDATGSYTVDIGSAKEAQISMSAPGIYLHTDMEKGSGATFDTNGSVSIDAESGEYYMSVTTNDDVRAAGTYSTVSISGEDATSAILCKDGENYYADSDNMKNATVNLHDGTDASIDMAVTTDADSIMISENSDGTATVYTEGNTENVYDVAIGQSAVSEYTVTFLDKDGNELKTQTVSHGDAAEAPELENIDGFIFLGWSCEYDRITHDTTVYAEYAKAVNTVTFYDMDGDVLDTQEVAFGEAATAPEAPEVTGYTFTEWDYDFSYVAYDMDVTAQYDKNTYIVTFIDGLTEEVICTEDIAYMDAAIEPFHDLHDGYTFIGWDKDFSCVTEDMTVTAIYKEGVYHFTTFVDGLTEEIIVTTSVEHGADAVFPTPPEHDGYTFTGWDSDGKNITSDTVITALYEENTSVILGDANGDGMINGKDVTLIRRYITGGYDVEVILEAADINGDGVINGKDITLLRRLIVGGYGDVA